MPNGKKSNLPNFPQRSNDELKGIGKRSKQLDVTKSIAAEKNLKETRYHLLNVVGFIKTIVKKLDPQSFDVLFANFADEHTKIYMKLQSGGVSSTSTIFRLDKSYVDELPSFLLDTHFYHTRGILAHVLKTADQEMFNRIFSIFPEDEDHMYLCDFLEIEPSVDRTKFACKLFNWLLHPDCETKSLYVIQLLNALPFPSYDDSFPFSDLSSYLVKHVVQTKDHFLDNLSLLKTQEQKEERSIIAPVNRDCVKTLFTADQLEEMIPKRIQGTK